MAMPVLDGVGATRAIKQAFPHIEVFGLSMSESRGVQTIERAGASVYFSKRAGAQALVERLLAEQVVRCVPPPKR